MKIAILSRAFAPGVGGLETMMDLLAASAAAAGHEVIVATVAEATSEPPRPYTVVRRPSILRLIGIARWADVVLHGGLSLKWLWLTRAFAPVTVVSHQTWLLHGGARARLAGRVKLWSCRHVVNVAISRAIADHLGAPAYLVPNAYADDVFRRRDGAPMEYDLAFVGRMVPDKGLHTLLDALAALGQRGLRPSLLAVGEGPERASLEALAARHGLQAQVRFAGALSGAALAHRLNRCRVLVVPSLWDEPFGIVALEGIACGCAVIASHGGGLPDAVGPCGVTFPNGDASALAARIEQLLLSDGLAQQLRDRAPEHLRRHARQAIAGEYLHIMQECLAHRQPLRA